LIRHIARVSRAVCRKVQRLTARGRTRTSRCRCSTT
jgi:hypothetical protein